jgi:hypothetical protein
MTRAPPASRTLFVPPRQHGEALEDGRALSRLCPSKRNERDYQESYGRSQSHATEGEESCESSHDHPNMG